MKTALIIPVALLAALPGCAGAGTDSPADATPAINAFAVDLYAQLRGEDGNLFLSPTSVGYALGMTRLGARGQTAREMDQVLHLPPDDPSVPRSWGSLMTSLNAETDLFTLRLANRLYGQEGTPFRTEFMDLMRDHFDGGLERVDFRKDAEGARQNINGWVSDQTAQRIPELLGSGTVHPQTRLVLVNAIYFLADWAHPFPAEQTKPRPFHLAGGEAPEVPMMEETATYAYAAPEHLQVLAMPYKGDQLDMVVLLPASGLTMAEFEQRLTVENLSAWLAAPERTRVRVMLPKFEFEAEFQLGPVLAAMGMPMAFTDRADFGDMIESGGLAIDNVVHKAYVRVDEKGTEAAAATGVTMRATSMPAEPPAVFKADRPFVFLIRHRTSGALLFAGRVMDPRG